MDNLVIIKPSKGWVLVDFKELWHYRDLLFFLTVRGIKAKYAQSVLGIGWAILQPVVTMVVFTVVFGRVAKVSSDGMPYALFAFLGVWPWNYFSGTLTDSANSLVSNASMITKVYFPRVVLPLSAIFSRFIDFVIAFVIMIGLLVYYQVTPGFLLLWLPLLIVQLLLTSIGLGMILSAMAVQFRDIRYALTFMVQIIMYGAPVVYSTNAIAAEFQFWFSLNPMVGVIEGFRSAFLDKPMPWHWIWPGSVVAIVLSIFGLFYFKKMERIFADVA